MILQVHLICSLLTAPAYQKSVFLILGYIYIYIYIYIYTFQLRTIRGLISVPYLEMTHLIISNSLTHESSTCTKLYFLKHQVGEKYNTRGVGGWVGMDLTESKCLSKFTFWTSLVSS